VKSDWSLLVLSHMPRAWEPWLGRLVVIHWGRAWEHGDRSRRAHWGAHGVLQGAHGVLQGAHGVLQGVAGPSVLGLHWGYTTTVAGRLDHYLVVLGKIEIPDMMRSCGFNSIMS